MNYFSIIKKPVVTEKTSFLKEKSNKYVFFVDRNATVGKIKTAIEDMYKVKVLGVNTLITKSKTKRSFAGKRDLYATKTYKKAIITIPEKESINLFEKTK